MTSHTWGLEDSDPPDDVMSWSEVRNRVREYDVLRYESTEARIDRLLEAFDGEDHASFYRALALVMLGD